jgi:hypothetical protein
MRFEKYLRYLKFFNYKKFYKRKSCEYFRPITIFFYNPIEEDNQAECVILNSEIIKRIQPSNNFTNYNEVSESCLCNESITSSISVLNQISVKKLQVIKIDIYE